MLRRIPVVPLVLAALVGLIVLTSSLTAQPPTAPPSQPAMAPVKTTGSGIQRSQEENFKLYKRFADELLKLAQKWEKSDSLDERERAKSLRSALKLADEKGIENLFKLVVHDIGATQTPTGQEFQNLLARDATLIKALEEVLEALNTEDEAEKLKREIADLKELIKEVERIRRIEENLLARTNSPKSDPNKIAKDQAQNAKDTQTLGNRLAKGDPKDPKNASPPNAEPPKDDKSESKGEAKPGDNAAEQKPDTKDPKSDNKDPQGGMGEPKPAGEKPEQKGGMPPDAGTSKESPKEGAGEPMPGKGMGEPKPPSGSPMAGEPKPMPPSESKAQGDGKGEGKPSKGSGGEAKPMTPSGGKPSDSPPSGSKGSPPSGSPRSGPRPPNPNNPNDEARRKVEEAVPPQEDAEQDLKKDERPQATKKQDEAIKALTEALKELEKRLKQLREKEMLKKLEDLERRVAKMLKMQIEVYEATKGIDRSVSKNNNQKSTLDIQKAGVEGEKEGEIGSEADKALRLLEGEGTAVVFAGVLIEVKKDMDAVQKQLTAANVGPDTQLVEEQIIVQLQQMLEALKKAKQDLQNQPPPPPGQPPPPNDGKKNLIQLVEQLKLLKSLQVQLNDRTIAFGKRTPGEQATDTFLQEQLKQLGERQKTLQDMLHKIAAQLNQQ